MKTFPTLRKRTAGGKEQVWDIQVIPGDPPIIRTIYGLVDGKKQTTEEKILVGCNQGRSNATSPLEQAYLRAEQQWRHKKDRGHYGDTVEESADKRKEAPMLAQVFQDHANVVDWDQAFVQPKFDGNRCLAKKLGNEVVLWTRGGKVVTSTPHINSELCNIMSNGDVFDGELYIHGVPLNRLRSFLAKKQEASNQIQLRVYDKVMEASFSVRIDELLQAVGNKESAAVHPVETIRVSNEAEVIAYQATCLEQGFEGAMLRHGNAHYESGKRSRSLLKVKTFRDAEFPIVAIEEGRGRFEGCAVLVLMTEAGNMFRATAPGTLEAKALAWRDRDRLIGRLVTVKFQMMTSTDQPVPFLPVCVRYSQPLF